MKNKIIILGLLCLLIVIGYFFVYKKINPSLPINQNQTSNLEPVKQKNDQERIKFIAENLDTPWAIAILPASSAGRPDSPAGGLDRGMLITERSGQVRLITGNGRLDPKPVAVFNQVKEIGEGGLLGIALHPNFFSNNFVYFYYTYSVSGNNTFNRVVRMIYKDNKLDNEQIIVDRIPGASNHNGGRIKFGPDGNLYITTGDAQDSSQAQDINSLAGKILRVTDEGKEVTGNPFGNLVYSYGHRNPQGLAWDSKGRLWATEHGRSGLLSGFDELNLIESGNNYGWPTIEGNETRGGMETPKLNSGSSVTWAPSGAAVVGNSIFFAGLRGEALYEAVISGNKIQLKEHFKNEFGRIREVILGEDNNLYITTSNQDGRGMPKPGDDKVISINLLKL